MEDLRKVGSRIQSYTWVLIAAWTVVIVISLGWNLYQALAAAQINFDKDLLYRRWGAIHGGFTSGDAGDAPEPYLEHVPERDLTTPSGRQLTLMNLAYMTKQPHDSRLPVA